MRKSYLDTAYGQVHARFWHEEQQALPLLCLPPAPHTGIYFNTLANHLDYPMIALDYPGTGSSTPLDGKPSIEGLARVIGGLLPKIGKVNVMGFHSGCLVALELAANFSAQIEKAICVDFPYFDAATRKKYLKNFADVKSPKKPEDLAKSFDGTVTKRRDDIGESRALELWVESLRAGPRYNDVFQAAFSFDVDAALTKSDAAIHFIATGSTLAEPTKKAAELAKNGRLIEVMEISGNVFETGAAMIAPILRDDII